MAERKWIITAPSRHECRLDDVQQALDRVVAEMSECATIDEMSVEIQFLQGSERE